MKPSSLRRRTMQAVRSTDTGPELRVRKIVRRLGYGYRLHRKDLPGKPDLSFIGRRKAVFVHGCFWHGHQCPRGARVPKDNRPYWSAKIARNRERDASNMQALSNLGWRALVIWECELKDAAEVERRLADFLA